MARRALRRSAPVLVSLLTVGLAQAGCDRPQAIGDVNSIVAAASDSAWSTLQDPLRDALEPEAFTVRDERIFDVAQVDPTSADWGDFRRVRQVLVIGEPADPWVAEALDELSGDVPRPPAILQVRDVWARPQLVTVLLMPPGSPPSSVAPLIPQLGALYVSQLEQYARERMFVSGTNTALADSLLRHGGFALTVPTVYQVAEPRTGVFVFRNDQPDPSQLIRQIHVASRPAAEAPFAPATALEWRRSLAQELTQPAQVTDSIHGQPRELRVGEARALEIQGVWSNPPGDWPAGGPFISRLVQCPQRTFLVDAWLYAPGKSKYEYMVQLQTILESFRCAR